MGGVSIKNIKVIFQGTVGDVDVIVRELIS